MMTPSSERGTKFGTQPWRILDSVVHLREWGTRIIHPLPLDQVGATIGAARNNWLRIQAPGVAPQIALLARAGRCWTLRDLGGVRLDGVAHSVVSLSPGSEIEIGGITLIAESPRLVALRGSLERLLGWAPDRAVDVDLAMRAVRRAALHREPLLLCGSVSDVLSAARLLHQHTFGNERPFVVCATRRATASGRDAIIIAKPLPALRAAAGGTLCIWQGHRLAKLVPAIRRSTLRTQLMVFTFQPLPTDALFRSPIVVPTLRRRAAELERLIDEYLVEARAELGGTFLPVDRTWIRRYDAATHARIESAARRVVALRGNGGSVIRAATVLGMASSALYEWAGRRKIPDLIAAD
jgi:hypothetical protein